MTDASSSSSGYWKSASCASGYPSETDSVASSTPGSPSRKTAHVPEAEAKVTCPAEFRQWEGLRLFFKNDQIQMVHTGGNPGSIPSTCRFSA